MQPVTNGLRWQTDGQAAIFAEWPRCVLAQSMAQRIAQSTAQIAGAKTYAAWQWVRGSCRGLCL